MTHWCGGPSHSPSGVRLLRDRRAGERERRPHLGCGAYHGGAGCPGRVWHDPCSATRAFLSLQLAHVLAALTSRGRTVIADVYPPRVTDAVDRRAPAPAHQTVRRTVTWASSPGVVQQLELRDLVDTAATCRRRGGLSRRRRRHRA